MNTAKIKEKISLAEEAVKDIADEKLKVKAFELVLNNLLSSEKENSNNSIKPVQLPAETQSYDDSNAQKLDVSKLLLATGLEVMELGNIIEFSDNDFHIIKDVGGSKEIEKQRNAALIIMALQYYCRGHKEIKAGFLRKKMEDMGIKSLVNMSTNLKNFENFILKIGSRSSPETKYRITTPGLQRGVELIKMAAQRKNTSEGKS